MGRIIALDYGTKRVGIAITDELQIIASGLCTVSAHDCIDFLTDYFVKESVDFLVMGLPKDLKNNSTDATPYVKGFARKLRKVFPSLVIRYVDERFTSKMAFKTLLDSGVKKKNRKDKALIDEVSATLILQSYMEQNKFF
jgi:putative Holliday junction resolvase